MTRINCIPVEELTDKHLVAEYRELPRISKLAKVVKDAPKEYKLGTDHVKFFYDKGKYLKNRFNELVTEMNKRGFKTNYTEYREHQQGLNNNWQPTEYAKFINRKRIYNKLNNIK